MKFFDKKSTNSANTDFQEMEKNKRSSRLKKGDCIEALFITLIALICADIMSDY